MGPYSIAVAAGTAVVASTPCRAGPNRPPPRAMAAPGNPAARAPAAPGLLAPCR